MRNCLQYYMKTDFFIFINRLHLLIVCWIFINKLQRGMDKYHSYTSVAGIRNHSGQKDVQTDCVPCASFNPEKVNYSQIIGLGRLLEVLYWSSCALSQSWAFTAVWKVPLSSEMLIREPNLHYSPKLVGEITDIILLHGHAWKQVSRDREATSQTPHHHLPPPCLTIRKRQSTSEGFTGFL